MFNDFTPALSFSTFAAQASVDAVKPSRMGAEFRLRSGLLQVEFVTDRIVRIRSTLNPAFSKTPSLMRVPVSESPGRIAVEDDARSAFIELNSTKLTVRVNRASGAISYLDSDGQFLVSEDSTQPRWLERTEVFKSIADPASVKRVKTVDGERDVAGDYAQKKDRDAWTGGVKFRFADGEALYGLGFDETSDLNLRGTTKRLYQHNLRIVVPSLISTRGYGLLFDAYSAMTFSDGVQGGSMAFDVIEDLDYYFIAGSGMDGTIAGYRQLTGAAAMLPRWAYGYVQSKEHYTSQDEVVATVNEFRKRGIPLDVVVQDWNYWISDQWGGDPDRKRYPDIAKMVEEVHDMNAQLMISIWPNPNHKSTAGKALAAGGYTLAGTTFFNVFDSKAREIYWQNAAWSHFGQHGMDGWWCDSMEPETADWKNDRSADPHAANIEGLAKIIDPQFLNAYGLMGALGIYENQRKDMPNRRVLNLTRSGYAGGQRTGAMVWTGDTTASWETLAQQVAAIQSISATGYPYITLDVGAFFVRSKSHWFWRGKFNNGVKDLGYRELYTRWLQLGAFLPMFRSHGTDTPREPWQFGEPGTPFYDAIIDAIDLRYRLLPHFYSLAGRVAQENASWIRPLAFDYPNDAKTHNLKNQFLVGDQLMIAPVLHPMKYGQGSTPITDAPETVGVYLPEGSSWMDFWTGQSEAGGRTIKVDAPLSHSPLLVKAGSILPLGPRIQYSDEKPGAPIELRIYPGVDAEYHFYEDAGDGWGYEKGRFSVTPITWNDKNRELTIGNVRGNFRGMNTQRIFWVVMVIPGRGNGLEPPDETIYVRYNGQKISLRL